MSCLMNVLNSQRDSFQGLHVRKHLALFACEALLAAWSVLVRALYKAECFA